MNALMELRKLSREDSEFLGELFHESDRRLRGYILGRLLSRNCGNKDVDELMGRVYDVACLKIDKLRSSKNKHGWLVLAAHYELQHYFREQKEIYVEDGDAIKSSPNIGNEGINLGIEEFFTKEFDDEDRDLLKRRYEGREKIKEIAREMHLKENNVKQRLKRARDAIRVTLKIKKKK